MLTHLSFPKLDKTKIFNIDSPLSVVFSRFGFLCQFISFFSEGYGVYGFLFENLPELPYRAKLGIAIGISLLIALLMEVLTFQLVTYSTKSFFTDYFKFKKATLIEWLKVSIPLIVLIVIIYFSYTVSKRNITFAVAANHVEDVLDLERYDQRADRKEGDIKANYQSDKKDLDNSYQDRKNLTEKSYQSKIDALEGEITILQRLEVREVKSYRSRKMFFQKRINEARQQMADELKLLKEQFDKDLKASKNKRDTALEKAGTTIAADKAKDTKRNDEALEAKKRRNTWIGQFLRELAGLSVFGFVFSRFWVVISFISTGIEEKNYFKPTFFQTGIIRDFFLLSLVWLTRKPHNAIRTRLAKFPALIPIQEQGAVISIEEGAFSPTLPPPDNKTDNIQPTKNDWEEILGQTLGEPDLDRYFSTNEMLSKPTVKTSSEMLSNEPEERRPIGFVLGKGVKTLSHKLNNTRKVFNINRSKEKHKERQKKKILKYWNSYLKKTGEKPTFTRIADSVDISRQTVSKYVKELEEEGRIGEPNRG